MRSLLVVPVTDPSAIDAAFAAAPDALVLDLASGERDPATRESLRLRARDVLRSAQLDSHRPHLYVRLEDLDDADFDRDLQAVMLGEPDGILLAGCRSGADVQHLGAKLAVHEAEYGLTDGETNIVAEAAARARALFNLGSYGDASPRLIGLSWHADGLAADLGGQHEPRDAMEFSPFHTARHLTLFAARAAEVAAIDSASLSHDPETILAECRMARRHGFNAKLATSPAEVAIIHAVFGTEGE